MKTIALPLPIQDSFDLSKTTDALISSPKIKKNKQQLWLCLYFPRISLEVFLASENNLAQVVIENEAGAVLVHTLNDEASEYGITEKMSLDAAYVLCPELKIYRRDESKEAINIAYIADWSQTFTSHVSIVSANKILLEIKGSLALFSGLESMLSIIENRFSSTWPYCYQMAVSPTPLASQLLCEQRDKIIVADEAELRPALGVMPIDYLLNDNARLVKKLNQTGLKVIQDLWRLPREGLARRFGVELLKTLDRLTGDMPDPRLIHQVSLKFEAFTELPAETSSQHIILRATNHLFEQLATYLRRHDAGVIKLNIEFKHLHSATDLVLYLRQMTRTASHILALFSEKMERTKLTATVIEVSLLVDEVLPFVVDNQMLFDDISLHEKNFAVDLDWENTLEQLQNRLGSGAVKYLRTNDDIHPDFAWCYQSTLAVVHHSGSAMRPLWLLEKPRPLQCRENLPSYYGWLEFLRGPERIQTGWWREGAQKISRDYYTVFNSETGYLWIYRDLLQNGRWYLHGFFG